MGFGCFFQINWILINGTKMKNKIISVILLLSMLFLLTACHGNADKSLSDIILSFGNEGPKEIHLEEKLSFSKKIDGRNYNMQGGANDGKYGYFVLNDGGDAGSSVSRIYKIDLTTWQIVKISKDLYLGHGNDVTYLPKEHQLAVTLCEAPATDAVIVDAESLEVVSYVTYPQEHPCMTYSPERDLYVFSSWSKQDDLTVYNAKFEAVKEIQCKFNFAEQCLTCDDELIYFLESPMSAGDSGYIFIYNWDGESIQNIVFPIEFESENISVYGDKFILAVNDHHKEKTIRFYELSFS